MSDTQQQQQPAPAWIEELSPELAAEYSNPDSLSQMKARVSAFQRRYLELVKIQYDVLTEGVDYGSVGDARTKVLMQPGAQKLAIYFGLHPKFEFMERIEDRTGKDHDGEPFFRYLVKCTLYDDQGNLVAEGMGEVNSWEARYRWRHVDENELPEDMDKGKLRRRTSFLEEYEFVIEKAQTAGEYGKPPEYWAMWQAALTDGSAISFQKKTAKGKELAAFKIASTSYRVPNEDIHSQVNTMIKMAQKRAFVFVVLYATGASEFFSQDLDDYAPETLQSIGISPGPRQPRRLPKSDDIEPGEKIKGDALPKGSPRQQRSSDGATNWTKGSAASLIPKLRQATGMKNLELFAALAAAGDKVTLDMAVPDIAAVLRGDAVGSPESKPAVASEPEPTAGPVAETGIKDGDVDWSQINANIATSTDSDAGSDAVNTANPNPADYEELPF